jgi:5-methylcytosine-specific restriction protein A
MKLANAIGRSTAEWIGKDADQRPPDYVRLRVFNRYEGKCYLSGKKIRPGDLWDLEHIVALCNGGENRESNMAPAFRGKVHNEKTARDRDEKARIDSIRKKHLGLAKPKRKIPGRRFNGEPIKPWTTP